jgi:hypothetical protein
MKTEWIRVEEKLPNMYDRVLALTTFFKDPLITNRFDAGSGEWRWDFSKYVGLHDCTITHWMLIPPPPIDSAP